MLDNATFRLIDVVPAWTRYVVLDFRYSAVSDEKRDGMLQFGVNLATGALPDAVLGRWRRGSRLTARTQRLPAEAELPPDWQRTGCWNWWTARSAHGSIRRWIHSSKCYAGGSAAIRSGSTRTITICIARRRDACPCWPKATRDGRASRSGSEAIRREYSAKLHDLSRQYAMRVAVEWVQTLELVMPVQRFAVRIRRRKAERVIHLDWNPLARRLESPPCEFRSPPNGRGWYATTPFIW